MCLLTFPAITSCRQDVREEFREDLQAWKVFLQELVQTTFSVTQEETCKCWEGPARIFPRGVPEAETAAPRAPGQGQEGGILGED